VTRNFGLGQNIDYKKQQENCGRIVGTRDQLKLHLLERLVNIERVYMERNFQKGELNDI
jgi:hypothetical protein